MQTSLQSSKPALGEMHGRGLPSSHSEPLMMTTPLSQLPGISHTSYLIPRSGKTTTSAQTMLSSTTANEGDRYVLVDASTSQLVTPTPTPTPTANMPLTNDSAVAQEYAKPVLNRETSFPASNKSNHSRRSRKSEKSNHSTRRSKADEISQNVDEPSSSATMSASSSSETSSGTSSDDSGSHIENAPSVKTGRTSRSGKSHRSEKSGRSSKSAHTNATGDHTNRGRMISSTKIIRSGPTIVSAEQYTRAMPVSATNKESSYTYYYESGEKTIQSSSRVEAVENITEINSTTLAQHTGTSVELRNYEPSRYSTLDTLLTSTPGAHEHERRILSSNIISSQYLEDIPEDMPVRYIEVPVEETQIQYVPRIQEVVREKRVPKITYEYIDKVVEVPQIHYVDRTVETEHIQEVIREVPKIEYRDTIKETIREVPSGKVEVRTVERIVDVPQRIEVPTQVIHENKVPRAVYSDKNQLVVVAQTVQPTIVETNATKSFEVNQYEPEVILVDIHVPKPVTTNVSLNDKATSHQQHGVDVPPAQFNSLLRSLNAHLSDQERALLPYKRSALGEVTFTNADFDYSGVTNQIQLTARSEMRSTDNQRLLNYNARGSSTYRPSVHDGESFANKVESQRRMNSAARLSQPVDDNMSVRSHRSVKSNITKTTQITQRSYNRQQPKTDNRSYRTIDVQSNNQSHQRYETSNHEQPQPTATILIEQPKRNRVRMCC